MGVRTREELEAENRRLAEQRANPERIREDIRRTLREREDRRPEQ